MAQEKLKRTPARDGRMCIFQDRIVCFVSAALNRGLWTATRMDSYETARFHCACSWCDDLATPGTRATAEKSLSHLLGFYRISTRPVPGGLSRRVARARLRGRKGCRL